MITALRPESFKRLQLDAGAFLPNLDYASATDAKSLRSLITAAIKAGTTKTLGATRGGGTFSLTPSTRNIEADGKRGEFVGSTINDGYTTTMTGTLLEFDENTFVALGGEIATEGAKANVKRLRFKVAFDDGKYIKSLVWVSEMSDGSVLMIDMKNALNTAGVTFTFTDKGEGTLPFTFTAHGDGVEDVEYAPVEVLIFSDAA